MSRWNLSRSENKDEWLGNCTQSSGDPVVRTLLLDLLEGRTLPASLAFPKQRLRKAGRQEESPHGWLPLFLAQGDPRIWTGRGNLKHKFSLPSALLLRDFQKNHTNSCRIYAKISVRTYTYSRGWMVQKETNIRNQSKLLHSKQTPCN